MGTNVKRLLGKRAMWIIGVCCLLLAIAVFVYLGYYFRWRWTGFPQKRLFDWIQILVIPVAVAIGTFVLNRAAKRRDDEAQQEQREREQAIETERAEEASLQAYLDYMAGMLTDPDRPLRRSHMGDNLSVVARAHTLTVLGRLKDGDRKRSVIQFLSEAGLIGGNYPVIALQGANLRGANLIRLNLQRADLRGADLHGAVLHGANLFDANLSRAYLEEAYLEHADLRGADLQMAGLIEANLLWANLVGAKLRIASLGGADLHGANLQGADLEEAWLKFVDLRVSKDLLTQDHLEQAVGDDTTTLPVELARPISWSTRRYKYLR